MTSWNPFSRNRKAKRRPQSKSPFPRPRYALYFEPLEYRWYPGDVLTALALSALGNLAFLFRDRLEAQLLPFPKDALPPAGGQHLPALLAETPNPSAWVAALATPVSVHDAVLTVPAGPPQSAADDAAATPPEAPLGGDWLGQLFGDPLQNPWAAGAARRAVPTSAAETGPTPSAGDGTASAPPGSPGGPGSGPFWLNGADPSAREQGAFLNGPLGPGTPPPDDPPPPDPGTPPGPAAQTRRALPRKPELQRTYGQVPLHFEPNVGQSDARVQFLSRGRGYDLFFTPTEAVLTLHKPVGERRDQRAVLRMQLVGANPVARAVGEERLPGITNYFLGNDPARWRPNVPNYRQVRFANVYPGVDLVYYGTNQRQLEYDFVVQPGANPNVIQLRMQGAEGARLDGHGHLVLPTLGGDVVQQAPVLYQLVNGRRQRVTGRHVMQGADRVGFQVGTYDASRPLYIDPVLNYSTYLGGSGNDAGYGIAVDKAGSAYVAGATGSLDFPTASPLYQFPLGASDVFVTKFDPTGSNLAYSTYLGGSSADGGNAIALDLEKNAYVVGHTRSTNFPTTASAFQRNLSCLPGSPPDCSKSDAFVVKLSPLGTSLQYSTYLGGEDHDNAHGIAVDGAGRAHVAGSTESSYYPPTGRFSGFPTTYGAFQSNSGGGSDAFVTKLNPGGTGLEYSTYLGGGGYDTGSGLPTPPAAPHYENTYGNGIALDSAGNVWVVGSTTGSFPTANPNNGYQQEFGNDHDSFLTKLSPTGPGPLLYSMYLGGSLWDYGAAVTVDKYDSVYISGHTGSSTIGSTNNFPTYNAFRSTTIDRSDGFFAKFTATGTRIYSSYFGGTGPVPPPPHPPYPTINFGDTLSGIAVNDLGHVYITGYTSSVVAFPVRDAWQPTLACYDITNFCLPDAFIAKLGYEYETNTWTLYYSSYLGGTGFDRGHGIALHPLAEMVYVVGTTESQDFPLVTPFQGFGYDESDAFVTRIGTMPVGRSNNPDATWLDVGLDEVALNTGTLRITQPLDFRRSVSSAQDAASFLGASSALVYNSDTVHVRPIGEITPRWELPLGVPTSIDLGFKWDGNPEVFSHFITTVGTHVPGDTYLLAAQVASATLVPRTGVYPWTFTATGNFSSPNPPTVSASFTDVTAAVVTDKVTDPNSFDNSPFGPGWGLAGLDRIVVTDYGPLRVFGSGAASRLYRPLLEDPLLGTATFSSPPDDFGTLVKVGITYTYTSKHQVKWKFERSDLDTSQYQLRIVEDPHNLTVIYNYKETNRRLLEEIVLPDGGRTTFIYSTGDHPRLGRIDEPGGRYLTFTYSNDTNKNLTAIRNADGGLRTFTYGSVAGSDARHVINDKWATQNVTYTYAATGGVSTVERGQATTSFLTPRNVIGLTLDPAPRQEDGLAVVLDPRLNATSYDLDVLGRVQQILSPLTAESWIRDHAGQVRMHTNSLGRLTSFAYDYGTLVSEQYPENFPGKGDLRRIDHPDGTIERFNYHPTFHYLTEHIDKLGKFTTYTYDSTTGDLLTVKDPLHTAADPRITTYTWSGGLLQTVTNARGFATVYTWNAGARRLVEVKDALTNRTTYIYDADALDDTGNVRAIRDAENRRTTFYYDGMRRVVTQMNAIGGITSFSYNALGQTTSVENPKGQKTAYDYDGRGWLTVTTEAAHLTFTLTNERRATTLLYDVGGNVTGVQDPRGGLTSYLYDALNRRTVTVDALGKRVTVIYDGEDNVTDLRDQLNRQTTFSYDALNRPFETTEAADVAALRRTSTDLYDFNGVPREERDPCTCGPGGVQHTLYYNDALGRHTAVENTLGELNTVLYDKVGNLIEQRDPRNNRTTFLYDALNRLTQTIQPVLIDAQHPKIATYYDKVGNVTGVLDQLNRLTSYAYDGLNRRTAVTEAALVNGDPSLLKRTTTTLYDAVGNVTGIETPKVGGVNLTQFNFDALNRRTATIDASGQTERIYYDKAGNVTGTLDKASRLTSFAYDALNRVTMTTEAAHLADTDATERRNTQTIYDAAGNVTVIVDHNGRRTSFLYDALNRKTVTIDADNKRTTVLYDNGSNVIGIRNARDQLTQFFVDSEGRVTGTLNPGSAGMTETIYDAAGNVTLVTDPRGNKTSTIYDALNRRTEVHEAVGTTLHRITTTTYDAAGNAVEIQSPKIGTLNNRTTFLFDALNRGTVTIDPLLQRTTQLYDIAGNVTGVEDRVQRVGDATPVVRLTSYAYDALHRRTEVTEAALVNGSASPLKRTTVTGYDAVGNVTVVITPAVGAQNNRTSFLYDALNRQTVVHDAMDFRVTTLYDKLGNVTLVRDKLDHWTSYAYDVLNRKTETTEAAHLAGAPRRTTRHYYDAVGNVTGMVNPLDNRLTSYAFDALNRVTAVTEAVGTPAARTTRTGYDDASNVTSIIDPAANTTVYHYDALNRRTVTIDALTKRTTVLYDAHNNVTQITDRNLRVRQFTYDEGDRQRKEIWLSGATPIHTITMDFDAPGRRTTVGDPKATYTYQYDDLNRQTVISNASSTGIPTVVLAQAFDARDRRTTLTATRQGVSDLRNTYSYDALGRLTSLTQSPQTIGVAYKRVDLAYNKLDQLLTVSRYRDNLGTPQLVAASEYFAYDDLNRLRGLTHKNGAVVFANYSWDFDTGDRLTTVNYQYGAATYTYDATDQLKLGSHVYTGPPANINEAYTYDANGNRTGAFQTGAGNRLATYTSGTSVWTYLYDGEGNRTERNLKVGGVQNEHVLYEWDYRNRLTTVTYAPAAGQPATKRVVYTYDALNRRIAQAITISTITTSTQYAYDGDNILFVFAGGDSLANLTSRYLTGPTMDQVFADEENGEPRWPLTDQLGTVRELVKWNTLVGIPEVVKALRYDAYGNRTDLNPLVPYAYSYTGREFESETGLYYYRARYYEPVVGTFLSEDIKGFTAGDPNFYRYVGNHPSYANDPDGMQEKQGIDCRTGRCIGPQSQPTVDTSHYKELGQFFAQPRRDPVEEKWLTAADLREQLPRGQGSDLAERIRKAVASGEALSGRSMIFRGNVTDRQELAEIASAYGDREENWLRRLDPRNPSFPSALLPQRRLEEYESSVGSLLRYRRNAAVLANTEVFPTLSDLTLHKGELVPLLRGEAADIRRELLIEEAGNAFFFGVAALPALGLGAYGAAGLTASQFLGMAGGGALGGGAISAGRQYFVHGKVDWGEVGLGTLLGAGTPIVVGGAGLAGIAPLTLAKGASVTSMGIGTYHLAQGEWRAGAFDLALGAGGYGLTRLAPQGKRIHLDIGGEGRYPDAFNVNPGRAFPGGPRTPGLPTTSTTGTPGRPIPNLVVADGERLPFANRVADLITIENAPINQRIASEVARVIRPGGEIRLMGPADYAQVAHQRVIQAIPRRSTVTQTTVSTGETAVTTTIIRVPGN